MLEVKNLSTDFEQAGVTVRAVKRVSFSLNKGEVLGIVGESGSGKSTLALSLLRLIDRPGRIVGGEIIFQGQDLLKLSSDEMIKIRGRKIAMIFQDPFTSLNPVYSVGDQIAEVIQLHQRVDRRTAWQKAVEALAAVKIKEPAERANDYPHQFSGGMRQRVMIAMALAGQPELLIADEPTTALDVTIQAEILLLLKELQQQYNLSILYITHNFGIVKQICSRVVVMWRGEIVEEGLVSEILTAPKQEYTKNLIDCLKVLA